MAELRQCSRCKSKIELQYFEKNRQGEYFKCCNNCRGKKRDETERYRMNHRDECVMCAKCGEQVQRYSITTHKRRFQCQVFGMETRPTFKEWLLQQNEDELVSEYKLMLKRLRDAPDNNNESCENVIINNKID